jgi:hypothetical protein
MGEASGSQLRIWNRSLASIVTKTGWYAELPPDTVWFVDPEHETADLHRHFEAAFANPDALLVMGQAGRRLLESRHDPSRYATELVEGIDRMMQSSGSVIGQALTAVAGIADASGITRSTRAVIARRIADELCRWISPPVRS